MMIPCNVPCGKSSDKFDNKGSFIYRRIHMHFAVEIIRIILCGRVMVHPGFLLVNLNFQAICPEQIFHEFHKLCIHIQFMA